MNDLSSIPSIEEQDESPLINDEIILVKTSKEDGSKKCFKIKISTLIILVAQNLRTDNGDYILEDF